VSPRLAAALVALALAAALLAGCGSSSDDSTQTTTPEPGTPAAPVGAAARSCETKAVDVEPLRATGISCDGARQLMYGWQQKGSCSSPAAASRVSCTTRSYRCLGARTDRGTAVSCSRPGRSVAFVAKRG
jgi:hypothetical protein